MDDKRRGSKTSITDDDDVFDVDAEGDVDSDTDVNIPDLESESLEDELPDDDFDLELDPPPTKAPSPKPAKPAAKKAAAPSADPGAATTNLGEKALGMTADIPIQLVAVLGKKSFTLQDLLQLELGQILDLGQPVSTMVDLVANGKLVAKGELVDIDGQLGVKIIRMVK